MLMNHNHVNSCDILRLDFYYIYIYISFTQKKFPRCLDGASGWNNSSYLTPPLHPSPVLAERQGYGDEEHKSCCSGKTLLQPTSVSGECLHASSCSLGHRGHHWAMPSSRAWHTPAGSACTFIETGSLCKWDGNTERKWNKGEERWGHGDTNNTSK